MTENATEKHGDEAYSHNPKYGGDQEVSNDL